MKLQGRNNNVITVSYLGWFRWMEAQRQPEGDNSRLSSQQFTLLHFIEQNELSENGRWATEIRLLPQHYIGLAAFA